MKVFKYKIEDAEIKVPKNAQYLYQQLQNSSFGNGLMAWYLVDETEVETRTDKFVTTFTGEDTPVAATYLKSKEMGELMVHLWLVEGVLNQEKETK